MSARPADRVSPRAIEFYRGRVILVDDKKAAEPCGSPTFDGGKFRLGDGSEETGQGRHDQGGNNLDHYGHKHLLEQGHRFRAEGHRCGSFLRGRQAHRPETFLVSSDPV